MYVSLEKDGTQAIQQYASSEPDVMSKHTHDMMQCHSSRVGRYAHVVRYGVILILLRTVENSGDCDRALWFIHADRCIPACTERTLRTTTHGQKSPILLYCCSTVPQQYRLEHYSNVPPPLPAVSNIHYIYIGWIGVGLKRHCKTCHSLLPRELGNQGTPRFFFFWRSPQLAIEVNHKCRVESLPHKGNDRVTYCSVVFTARRP